MRLQRTLGPLFFFNHRQQRARGGCTVTCMPKKSTLRISASETDAAPSRQNASEGSITDFSGPSLASEDMVRHDVAVRDTVLSSPMQGPAVPGRGKDSTPSTGTGTVVSMGLSAERENLIATGLRINVMATIKRARALSTRGLYALKWHIFEQRSR